MKYGKGQDKQTEGFEEENELLIDVLKDCRAQKQFIPLSRAQIEILRNSVFCSSLDLNCSTLCQKRDSVRVGMFTMKMLFFKSR